MGGTVAELVHCSAHLRRIQGAAERAASAKEASGKHWSKGKVVQGLSRLVVVLQ